MADPVLVPAGTNTPSVMFIRPDGRDTMHSTVAAFRFGKGEPDPVFWPAKPEGWLVAIESGAKWQINGKRRDLDSYLRELQEGAL